MKKFSSSIHRNNQKNIDLLNQNVLQTYARLPVTLVHGDGAQVWDADGKEYLDFFAGLAVDNLGHAPLKLRKALEDQAKRLWHCSNVFYIQEQAELAQLLVKLSGCDKVFFCNSGTEANEASIKLARYYGIKNKGPDCYEIIVADQSFHGRTLGALSATAQKKYQEGFGPLVPGFVTLPYNNLELVAKAINPKTCAILVEPIQGEGGVNVPDESYLLGLQDLCRKNNLLLILDEVQTGIGRTGHLFAYQKLGLKPDLVNLAKGLASGFPMGAALISKRVSDIAQPGIHASTFGGNPLASRMALETIKIVSKPSFLKKVEELGKYFRLKLNELKVRNPLIKEVRGWGLMNAAELNKNCGVDIVKACLAKGLLINSVQGNVLRFVPPLIITKKQINEAIGILESVLIDM